ncbi:MAG: hypothetical protein V1244_01840, partial [Nitrospinaceae bacterium]|nr:hypothetical protein [Nitrospinaceae bacterium]
FNLFTESYFFLKMFYPSITLGTFFNVNLKEFLKKGRRSKEVFADIFFVWAFEAGFPFDDEMLMNYFVFGDVSDDSEPLKTYKFTLMIDFQDFALASETLESLDLMCSVAERLARERIGREPTVKEFQESLKDFMKNDYRLDICINYPHKNKEKIISKISEIIDNNKEERSRPPESNTKTYASLIRSSCKE